MQRLPLIELREDVRKYREYREHALHSGAFFRNESVPSGKVDEDRVSRVRFQESSDYVVVLLQPVVPVPVPGELQQSQEILGN